MLRRSSCDLFECIEVHSKFNESTARYVFAQIVDAVHALNVNGICHRDIKDENVVVSTDFKVRHLESALKCSVTDALKPGQAHRFWLCRHF